MAVKVDESVGQERREDEEHRRAKFGGRAAKVRTVRALVATAHLANVQHVERRSVEDDHLKVF